MDIFKVTERLMLMSDDVWKRHANPLSVWTRIPIIYFLAFAIWSRVWLGWYALIPISLVVIWIWLNPRIFVKYNSIDNWATKGVYGERIYLRRKENDNQISKHHLQASKILTIISILGTILMAIGLYLLDFWMAFSGSTIAFLGKLWFCDRMVWIYEDSIEINEK